MDKKTVKLIEPNDIDDVQLPELTQWQNLFQRPTSLRELDPNASQELNDVEATFLSLGDLAYLDQITETEITDESISTPKLQAGAVEASKISVGSLSAISADLGSITAGTIVGAVIKTSNSGDRIEMENDRIDAYDSSDDLRLRLDDGYLKIYDSGSYVGQIGGDNNSMRFMANDNLGILGDDVSIDAETLDIGCFNDINFRIQNTLLVEINSSGFTSYGFATFENDVTFEDNVTFDQDVIIGDDLVVADNFILGGNQSIIDGNMEIDKGFVNLAQMSGSQASSQSGDQDGSMYYRTGNDDIRVKVNGNWRTITTS